MVADGKGQVRICQVCEKADGGDRASEWSSGINMI